MKHSVLTTLLLAALAGCTYDPPPDAELLTPRVTLGELVRVRFSEPVVRASIAVAIWPGKKDVYGMEGERKPGTEALVPSCTLSQSPCGGVTLAVDEARTELTLEVPDGALPMDEPLVLELSGRLEDDAGRTKDVVQSFEFQIVRPSAPRPDTTTGGPDVVTDGGATGDTAGDAAGIDTVPVEPLGIPEGPHLFYGLLKAGGMEIQQQFFMDLELNQTTGDFVFVIVDADVIDPAPLNTKDPDELRLMTDATGFLFTVHGEVRRTEDGLAFESEPFTLVLSQGITFELRGAVMRGAVDPENDPPKWDGLLVVEEVFVHVGAGGQSYPDQQSAFEVFVIPAAKDGMPTVCEADPCAKMDPAASCDILSPWPPAGVCGEGE